MNEAELHKTKANWIYKGEKLRIAWFRLCWWKKFALPGYWFFSFELKPLPDMTGILVSLCLFGLLIQKRVLILNIEMMYYCHNCKKTIHDSEIEKLWYNYDYKNLNSCPYCGSDDIEELNFVNSDSD